MKLIVSGSRHITHLDPVAEAIAAALRGWGISRIEIDKIIHGGAPGVDGVADRLAEAWRIPVRVFLADWKTHGLKAGPRRNQQMADACDPEVDGLVAVPAKDSRGTWDMVRRATQRGLKVYVAGGVGMTVGRWCWRAVWRG